MVQICHGFFYLVVVYLLRSTSTILYQCRQVDCLVFFWTLSGHFSSDGRSFSSIVLFAAWFIYVLPGVD